MDGDLLMRRCPACGDAYGEHTLVSLAECIDGLFDDDEDREEASDLWWEGLVRVPNLRPVEVVVTDLL